MNFDHIPLVGMFSSRFGRRREAPQRLNHGTDPHLEHFFDHALQGQLKRRLKACINQTKQGR